MTNKEMPALDYAILSEYSRVNESVRSICVLLSETGAKLPKSDHHALKAYNAYVLSVSQTLTGIHSVLEAIIHEQYSILNQKQREEFEKQAKKKAEEDKEKDDNEKILAQMNGEPE